MNPARTFALMLPLLAVLAAALPCPARGTIRAVVPPELGLKAEEIETALAREGVICPSGSAIVLAVYFYTESIEEMAYSGEGVTSSQRPGRIKVLMKFRTGNRLKKVYFLEAAGNEKREILDNLAREARRALR
ncbi:MAG TPA: hypothetical protein P5346_05035 [Spirochaetota bacterium]|nr:hypothetical protein [Spirochaetota bacterium]HSA14090.1 hypothetical protein [Spirochaetota bacterium]